MKSRFGAHLGSIGLLSVSLIGHASAQSAPSNWSGAYVGAFGGYGGGQSAQHDNGFVYTPPGKPTPPGGENGPQPVDADGNYGLHGAVGGGLVGFNYQFGQTVVGLEADIAGTSISGSSASCGTPAHQCGTNIRATADVRGRLGYAMGAFMPFVAGGLALQDVHAYDSLFGSQGSAWQAGYTIGGGVEYKFTPMLALRLEYLHSGFGSTRLFDIVPGVPERVRTSTDMVRVGLTFSFGATDPVPAPVIARY